jgi:hypothetical protein
MFSERSLPDDVAGVRADHAPGAVVLDCDRDFEMLSPSLAEDLALFVEEIRPPPYEESWVPPDAPATLRRVAGPDFTVGAPGDGSVAWTRRTDPPVVLVKPRAEGSPESFVDFLLAAALVEAGAGLPEQFLGLFEDRYPDFAAALDAGPADTYQVAAACCVAYRGLSARETFEEWPDTRDRLGEAWADAGERVAPRVADLNAALARGKTTFPEAAELACGAVKHGVDLPAPFAALDSPAFRQYGADFAVEWAQRL